MPMHNIVGIHYHHGWVLTAGDIRSAQEEETLPMPRMRRTMETLGEVPTERLLEALFMAMEEQVPLEPHRVTEMQEVTVKVIRSDKVRTTLKYISNTLTKKNARF